jgi:hypothetical protein
MRQEEIVSTEQGHKESEETANGTTGRPGGLWKRLRGLPVEIPLFFLYFLTTSFLTWPLIVKFTTSIYGVPGDNYGGLWLMWWYRNAASLGAKISFSPLIGFPFGTRIQTFPMEPVSYLVTRFLLLFTPEVPTYNLDIFLSFFLAGITMYFLVRYLTRDRRAAFFAGLAYMIIPYHAFHAMFMGGGISTIQWMPLFILLLLKYLEKPTVRSAVLLALGGILVAGTSIHYGLFMAVFTGFFLLGRLVHKWLAIRYRVAPDGSRERWAFNRRTFALSLLIILLLVVVITPFAYIPLLGSSSTARWPTSPTPGQLRIARFYSVNSAQPSNYVLPNADSGLLRYVGANVKSLDKPLNWDTSLYIGWIVIVLAFMGIIFWGIKRRREPDNGDSAPNNGEAKKPRRFTPLNLESRHIIWGLIAAAVGSFILSMRPGIRLGSVTIPLPSKFFMLFIPWFRWYLRIGMVVGICMIVLAGYGLAWALGKIRRRLIGAVVLVACIVILVLEMAIVPPFRNTDFAETPGMVTRLSALPASAALVGYPLYESYYFQTSELMFYQRLFKKPMLNGAADNTDGEALRRTVFNPFEKATLGVLRRFKIDYLLLRKSEFRDPKRVQALLSREQTDLQLVADKHDKGTFGDSELYKITAPRADIVPLYLGDITVPQFDEDMTTARLVVRQGVIRLLNYSGKNETVDLKLPIQNPISKRDVVIAQGNKPLWGVTLDAKRQVTAQIHNLVIPPKGLELTLTVNGPVDSLTDYEMIVFGSAGASLRIGDVQIITRQ